MFDHVKLGVSDHAARKAFFLSDFTCGSKRPNPAVGYRMQRWLNQRQ